MDQFKISREESFLDSKKCADCKFLVGADFAEIGQEISGHRAIFANASPVFNTMFFGSVPETGDFIKVPDIRPETFLTMVNFFYTGEITIDSVEQAVDLWYVADKYNIAEFIKYIPKYLIKKMTPQNVCYIRKSAILFRNEIVKEKCDEKIIANISTVLNDASFLEPDLSILSFILDQNKLNVFEIDLFRAVVRYDIAQKHNSDDAKPEQPPSTSFAKTVSERESVSGGNSANSYGEGSSNKQGNDDNGGSPVKEIMKKIRFLAMSPKEFVECLGMSSLISPLEAHSILVNITDPTVLTHPMPEGYCTIKEERELINNINCYHSTEKVELVTINYKSPPNCIKFSLKFKSSAKIKMTGLRLSTDRRSDLNYTMEVLNPWHSKVLCQSDEQPFFVCSDFVKLAHPVLIDPGLYYTISIELRRAYSEYSKGNCSTTWTGNDVTLTFDQTFDGCTCKGFFNSIVFAAYL